MLGERNKLFSTQNINYTHKYFMQEDEGPSGVNALTLKNVGGIFLVLLIGVILGGIIALLEFFWERCKKRFNY